MDVINANPPAQPANNAQPADNAANPPAQPAQVAVALPVQVTFQRRPMFNWVLNFTDKLHKSIYDGGCTKVYKDYDVDDEARHAFVTAFSFKVKQMAWGGDNNGILHIPQGLDPSGNPVYKFLLDSDGEFSLSELKAYVATFINTDTQASQDDAMV